MRARCVRRSEGGRRRGGLFLAEGLTPIVTYNARGQILTATTPARAGITENRTTTYTYDTNGYLQSVTGPASGATAGYTYDGYGRLRTVTDADAYALTADYDALDRLTRVTFPDGTYQEATYNRLDVGQQRDRLGRFTSIFYDKVRHPVAIQDPKNNFTTLTWCGCGALDKLTDANGHATSWTYDLQGRVLQRTDADSTSTTFSYESTTSRLKSQTDAKNQTLSFGYFPDNRLKQVTHTGATVATPDVSLTYDNVYPRVKTRTDGTGTTIYAYNPVNGALGSGRLASVTGPWANSTVTYAYDELGRVASRSIGGVAASVSYDNLWRATSVTNALGSFSYGFDGITSRIASVSSTNGPRQTFTYLNNAGGHQLQEILNKTGAGAVLSKFDYAYNAANQITSWTQQLGSDPNAAKVYGFGYDGASRLTSAMLQTATAPQTLVHSYAYGYDQASNRTSEQIDGVLTAASHNQDNELTGLGGAGNLQVRGTTNEPAQVTVGGNPVPQSTDNSFAGQVAVGSGTSNFAVTAKDYSGNQRTSTYQVTVSGTAGALTYDPNGNVMSDGVKGYEWDGENRLTAINQGSHRTEMRYDSLGRRVEIIEKDNGTVTSDKKYLWVGHAIVEERDSTGATVTKRYFGQGVQIGSAVFFYTRDHLGSIRELVDSTGAVRAQYSYDPYGRRTKISGDADSDIGFTGHWEHAPSGLKLTWFRAYDSNLGRWLSRDPAGLMGGLNLYAYADDDPINGIDSLGLECSGLKGWKNAFNMFHDFVHGTGPANRFYSQDDFQTQDMLQSAAWRNVWQQYTNGGDGKYYEGTIQGYEDTFFVDRLSNPTAFYVGGFKATFTDLNDGYVQVVVHNDLSFGSGIGYSALKERYPSLPDRPWPLYRDRQTPNLLDNLLDTILPSWFTFHPLNMGSNISEDFYFRCKK